ncbi:DUF7878 domain-containing protein [Saccharomonospora cyanea]|uniref:DUF7878 domain-containing protein n=1 Tax=Saccharomonospora cyanea NA-134 TaxID=882082 RepID=H5XFH0_9PSEU|nr:hypothetical protein [Saccharomonospora cyanea]EHR62593.1 hypothetical protein SaccyDRAFT_3766 [Saccharomonospora cyanea NA-134]
MIRIRYTGLTTADLNPEWTALGELFVHVEADISIWDGERELYSEILFPVLELASRVHDWTRVDSVDREDFELDSLSFEETGVVRIVRFGPGWSLGSVHEPGRWSGRYSLEEVDAAVLPFVRRVRAEAEAKVGIDLSMLFEES